MAPLQILGTEWIFVILVVLILLFGSKKVPELARSLGKAIGEFQKGRAELEKEIKAASQTIQEPIAETTQVIQSSLTEEPRPAPSPPPTGERERLEKAASDLGITIEGKTDEQLKEEIRKALS